MSTEEIKRKRSAVESTGSYGAMAAIKLPRPDLVLRYKRYRELANLHESRGKLRSAQRCLEKAILLSTSLVGTENSTVVSDLESLAKLMEAQGKHVVSRALLSRVSRARAS